MATGSTNNSRERPRPGEAEDGADHQACDAANGDERKSAHRIGFRQGCQKPQVQVDEQAQAVIHYRAILQPLPAARALFFFAVP